MNMDNRMTETYSDWVAKQIGNNIQRKRKAAKMSIYQLSKLTGVNWSTLKNWESGVNAPHIDFLRWVCDHTGWTMADLLGGLL